MRGSIQSLLLRCHAAGFSGVQQGCGAAQRLLASAALAEAETIDNAARSDRGAEASPSDGGLQTLRAWPRDRSGSSQAQRLRQGGRTPAILFSLPGNESRLVTVDAVEMTRELVHHGRTGLMCRRLELDVAEDSTGQDSQRYPVLPRVIHINAVSDVIENVTFMWCPPERLVEVEVPITVIGEDASPGIKRGGYINLVRRTVRCLCAGEDIPESLEINVAAMDIGASVLLGQLPLPDGVVHAVREESHLAQPLCKIGGRARRTE